MKAKTLLALIVGTVLFGFQTKAEKPDKFLRYVEATGSQYVDTGIVGRYGTKAECKVEWMAFSDSAFLDCGDWSDNTRFFMCHCSTTSGNIFAGYGTGEKITYNSQICFSRKNESTHMCPSIRRLTAATTQRTS